MKLWKLSGFVLLVALVAALPLAINFLKPILPGPRLLNTDFVASTPFLSSANSGSAVSELRPALWWTVLAVLLIDIGCVIGYLHYQRQCKWRQIYWRLTIVDNQRLLALFTALYTTELHLTEIKGSELNMAPRNELLVQKEEGGFYIALRPKKAPAHYGPALFL